MEIGGAEGDGGGILHSHMKLGRDRQDRIGRRGIGEGISDNIKGVLLAYLVVRQVGGHAGRPVIVISGMSGDKA